MKAVGNVLRDALSDMPLWLKIIGTLTLAFLALIVAFGVLGPSLILFLILPALLATTFIVFVAFGRDIIEERLEEAALSGFALTLLGIADLAVLVGAATVTSLTHGGPFFW